MKQIFSSAARKMCILCALLSPCLCLADGDGGSGSADLDPTNPIGQRPKAPSMQYISCTYMDGMLYVDFAYPEGECVLTVTNLSNGLSSSYGFDSTEAAEIYVGNLAKARLDVTTAYGNSYQGELTVEF